MMNVILPGMRATGRTFFIKTRIDKFSTLWNFIAVLISFHLRRPRMSTIEDICSCC